MKSNGFNSNRRKNIPGRNNSGFTLIELLVVIAIIGVLTSIGLSAFNGFKETTRVSRCIAEIRDTETAITAYALEKGELPNSLADIGRANYLDPWKRPYLYKKLESGQMRYSGTDDINSDFDFYSTGNDGLTALSIEDPLSSDDVIRANNLGYIGLASKY
jgi:prepilin-type N-terminal cleavage/methylation domain-containing protein